jgi:hypothetical protein
MKELKEHGYDIGTEATTIDEAVEEIKDYFTKLARVKYRGR